MDQRPEISAHLRHMLKGDLDLGLVDGAENVNVESNFTHIFSP